MNEVQEKSIKTNRYYLILDFGTGSGKCTIVSCDGNESYDAYQELVYEYPPEVQPGGSEFDPRLIWNIFADLIKTCMLKAGVDPAQIVGISSTSQREGVVFLDEDDRELYSGPNIDMRAPSDAEQFTKKFAEWIHTISGHWPFPMFLPYRLLWFKEKHPDKYDKIKNILLLNNWLLFKLCDAKVTDPSNGIETLLLNINTNDWDYELISKIGFDVNIFPPVFESGTIIGEVTPKAAIQTGLKPGTPVIIGGADTQCAMLGSAVVHDGNIGVVLGTYGPVQMVVSQPIIAQPELIWSGSHVIPNAWVIESSVMETGQAYRWLRDTFYKQDGDNLYELMNNEALASIPGANNVLAYIGPRLPNYRKLEFSIDGGFVTKLPPLPDSNQRGDFSRAIIESVAFGIRMNVNRLERISNKKITHIHISGGLTKSDLLLKCVANTLNTIVKVPINKEGSALGAAICAGVGIGDFTDMKQGSEMMVRWEKEIAPNQNEVSLYQDLLEIWLSQYHKMYGEKTLIQ